MKLRFFSQFTFKRVTPPEGPPLYRINILYGVIEAGDTVMGQYVAEEKQTVWFVEPKGDGLYGLV